MLKAVSFADEITFLLHLSYSPSKVGLEPCVIPGNRFVGFDREAIQGENMGDEKGL